MLLVTQDVMDALVIHARNDAPLEACGYLAEKDGVIVRHYPLTNVDASPEHFALSPEEQFSTVRAMRAEGCRLRALYHSHPLSAARPSAEDIKLAYDPGISYVIISLSEGNGTIRSFRIRGTFVESEDIAIASPPANPAPADNNYKGDSKT